MYRYIITVLILVVATTTAWAQDTNLKQCQRYKDQADRYQELRRKGGHGEQMDEWKNKMREYQQQYRDGNCHKHSRKLKG